MVFKPSRNLYDFGFSAYSGMAERQTEKLQNPYERLYQWQAKGGLGRRLVYAMIPGTGVYDYMKGRAGKGTAILDIVTTALPFLPVGRIARGLKGVVASRAVARGLDVVADVSRFAGTVKRYQALEKALAREPKIIRALGVQTSRTIIPKATPKNVAPALKAIEQFERATKFIPKKPVSKLRGVTPAGRTVGTFKNIVKTTATSKAVQTGAKVGAGAFLAGLGIDKLRDSIESLIPLEDEGQRRTLANVLTFGLLAGSAYFTFRLIRGG